jgi:hypothetical protein
LGVWPRGLELALALEDSLSRFDVCVCVGVGVGMWVRTCAQVSSCVRMLRLEASPRMRGVSTKYASYPVRPMDKANGQRSRTPHAPFLELAAHGVHRSNPSWFRVRALAAYSSAAPYDEVQARLDQQWIPKALTPR